MKKPLLLLVLLLPCLFAWGQKAKGDQIKYTFLRKPMNPLEGEFTTYSFTIKDDNRISLKRLGFLDSKVAEQHFDFDQYERKMDRGDFELVLDVEGDNIISRDVKSTTKTEGKGDDAKKVTYYYYEVKYCVPASYQLLDGAREVMRDGLLGSCNTPLTYKGKEFRSKTSVYKHWDDNEHSIKTNLVTDRVRDMLVDLGRKLHSEIDAHPYSINPTFYSIKKADKYNAEQYDEAFEITKKILAKTHNGISQEELQKGLEPAMNIWKEGLTKYDVKNKKEVGMYFASAYNLAQACTMLEAFDAAQDYLDKAVEADKKGGEVRALQTWLEQMIARDEANKSIPNKFVGTYQGGGEEDSKRDVPLDYVITSRKDTVYGEINITYGNLGIDRIKVTNYAQEVNPTRSFKSDEVKLIRNYGYYYHLIPMSRTENMGIPSIELAQLLHFNEKVGLYRVKAEEETIEEFCFLKYEDKAKAVSTNALKFIKINKGIASYFDDCPNIVKKAEEKSYKRSENGLMEVIDDYETCKQ